MRLELWIERQTKKELAQMPSLLTALVEKLLSEYKYNIHFSPARNGFPRGYAKTFKISVVALKKEE